MKVSFIQSVYRDVNEVAANRQYSELKQHIIIYQDAAHVRIFRVL